MADDAAIFERRVILRHATDAAILSTTASVENDRAPSRWTSVPRKFECEFVLGFQDTTWVSTNRGVNRIHIVSKPPYSGRFFLPPNSAGSMPGFAPSLWRRYNRAKKGSDHSHGNMIEAKRR
jgi:hypothetical protein